MATRIPAASMLFAGPPRLPGPVRHEQDTQIDSVQADLLAIRAQPLTLIDPPMISLKTTPAGS